MSYSSYEVPDGITPLVGYRGWTVKDGKLWSAYPDIRAVEWPTNRPLQSECLPPQRRTSDEHDRRTHAPKHYYSPHIDCTCGVYALHEYPKQGEVGSPWPKHRTVTGMIHGWGKIIVGDKGFRAQYARPIALVSHRNNNHDWPKVIQSLAERYGLEIVDYREVRK